MPAPHPLVHGEFGRNIGLLARLQCRRTDDRLGWSAAFNGFNPWIHRKTEGLIPHIAQTEAGCDESFKANIAKVYEIAVYRQPGTPLIFRCHHL
ncbi:MAG TPA: hypothetical protein VEH53_00225 [archaeon]|nr:hypothetical protein [archaeon]